MRARRHGQRRRPILGALALAALAAPALASGCASGFAPVSEIDGLRVLAVQADKPYAVDCAPCSPEGACTPKCTLASQVTFQMTYDKGTAAGRAPVQVVWLGGCYDPDGDDYYACYPDLAKNLAGFDVAKLLASGMIGIGDTFTLPIPSDIVTRRPKPTGGGSYYGIAYVFFAVCAGTLGPVPVEGTGAAGSFPIGCFDAKGNRLGADSFVPGYTQVYAFSDLRDNENPVVIDMTLDGDPLRDGVTLDACAVPTDDRLATPGCGRPDPFQSCTAYDLSVNVPDDVAEIDPDGTDENGKPLHEAVWVDYFADQGSIDSPVLLLSDPTTGIQHDHGTRWIGPPSPSEDGGSHAPLQVNLWAVVHDARGGETVAHRTVQVP